MHEQPVRLHLPMSSTTTSGSTVHMPKGPPTATESREKPVEKPVEVASRRQLSSTDFKGRPRSAATDTRALPSFSPLSQDVPDPGCCRLSSSTTTTDITNKASQSRGSSAIERNTNSIKQRYKRKKLLTAEGLVDAGTKRCVVLWLLSGTLLATEHSVVLGNSLVVAVNKLQNALCKAVDLSLAVLVHAVLVKVVVGSDPSVASTVLR